MSSGGGERLRGVSPNAYLTKSPELGSEAVSSILFGEALVCLEKNEGYCRVRTVRDDYVGWVQCTSVSGKIADSTHHVVARSAPVHLSKDIKSNVVRFIPFGAEVTVRGQEGRWSILNDGFAMMTKDLRPHSKRGGDPVEFAENYFLHAPYVWGGKCSFGTDCSGLVQSCYHAVAYALPRDSHQQIDVLSPYNGAPTRGVIAGFKGHIGMMVDDKHIIHANAHSMSVAIEPLSHVIDRAEQEGDKDAFLGLFQCPVKQQKKRKPLEERFLI